MTLEEFKPLAKQLHYSFKFMFPNNDEGKEQLLSWITYLCDYTVEEAEKGVRRYILNHAKEPSIADIIDSIKAVRAEKPKPYKFVEGFYCIHCKDTGLIVWEDEDGRFYGRPCGCKAGVEKYGTQDNTA